MSDDNIELPAEKAYYIQKMEVAKEIQSELLDWAKRRVWITGAVIAVVGFFGINGLVISSVYTVLREDLRNAHASTVLASEAAEKARKTMANAEQNEEKLELLGHRADGCRGPVRRCRAQAERRRRQREGGSPPGDRRPQASNSEARGASREPLARRRHVSHFGVSESGRRSRESGRGGESHLRGELRVLRYSQLPSDGRIGSGD